MSDPTEQLWICPDCYSPSMNLVNRRRISSYFWELDRSCDNCKSLRKGEQFTVPTYNRFLEHLDKLKAGEGGLPFDTSRPQDCPQCGKDYVVPVNWKERKAGYWEMLLRCGNCAWSTNVLLSRSEAERYDKALEEREEVLFQIGEKVERRHFKEYQKVFVAALRNGLTADDFRSPGL